MRKFYYFFIKSGLPFLLLNMMILGGAKAIIRTNQNSLDYISLNINEAEISEKVKVDDIPTDPDYFWELIREDLDSGMRSNGNFPPIWDEPSITETIHGYIVPLSSYPRVNDIPLKYGDYIGYPESETKTRFYTVTNDGKVVSDNRHVMGGFKPYYRTITCAYVQDGQFRGI